MIGIVIVVVFVVDGGVVFVIVVNVMISQCLPEAMREVVAC